MSNLQEDLEQLKEKHNIEQFAFAYQEKGQEGIHTQSSGNPSNLFEISAMMFGYFKKEHQNHIAKIVTSVLDRDE